ncbi:helix-turn-helix domain-containing protein [Gluconobacter cerinus]|uniref:helix-turn-helix domain-containing protein n=1 Tax=Gluconobacter cerinus TaxID=38307 RepID=UPI001B8B66BF|nr:helix-turn-helix domain-containing protein [Gluconobacter cerinus]MBS1038106.1 helix-turn-helix domain-containing protein [Gluconobacter cerinus]
MKTMVDASDYSKRKIIKLYNDGMSKAEISRKMDITYSSILSFIEKSGFYQKKYNRLNSDDITNITLMFRAGRSIREISEDLKIHIEAVRRTVKKSGFFESKYKRITLSVSDTKRIISMFESGYTKTQIAEIMDINLSKIKNTIDKYYKYSPYGRIPKRIKRICKQECDFCELKDKGMSKKEIEERMNINHVKYYYFLKKLGYSKYFKKDIKVELKPALKSNIISLIKEGKNNIEIRKFAEKRNNTVLKYSTINDIRCEISPFEAGKNQ